MFCFEVVSSALQADVDYWWGYKVTVNACDDDLPDPVKERRHKIDRVRTAVEAGKHSIDVEMIAVKLIDHGFPNGVNPS